MELEFKSTQILKSGLKMRFFKFNWEKQRQEVTEYIGEFYQKYGDSGKTMQEHHWIEQSRIKDRDTYPFLSCPPMKEDLLKSKSNLSLIVGHNGGHKKSYNDLLDDKLDYITDFLDQMSKNTGIPVSNLLKKEDIMVEINNQVRQIIMDLSNSVKKDHTILNNVEKMFVLD